MRMNFRHADLAKETFYVAIFPSQYSEYAAMNANPEQAELHPDADDSSLTDDECQIG